MQPGRPHETGKIVRLGLPRIPSTKRKRSRIRLQLVLCDDWHANTGCLVAQDLALLTKVRTLIHEEISLPTVLYFPFRRSVARTAASASHGTANGGRLDRCENDETWRIRRENRA